MCACGQRRVCRSIGAEIRIIGAVKVDGSDIKFLDIPLAEQAVALKALVADPGARISRCGGGSNRSTGDTVGSHHGGAGQVVLKVSGRLTQIRKGADTLQTEAADFKGP